MKNNLFRSAAILVLLSTAACSGMFMTKTSTINLPTVSPNLPAPPHLSPVNWHVYTNTDLNNYCSSKNKPAITLFTLSPDQNADLNKNIVEMQRYILELQKTITYYQNLTVAPKN